MTIAVLQQAGRIGGKTPKHYYTEDEKAYIRANYKGTRASAAAIAEHLGVTTFGIVGQAQKLGICRQRSPDWTQEEYELLEKLAHSYSTYYIARKLHRSQNAVKVKIARLKIKLRVHYGWYTKKEVCEILGEDHHKIQQWIDSGELKASWHGVLKPKAAGQAMWHIDRQDLRSFIVRHAAELLGRNVDLQQIIGLFVDQAKIPESLKGSVGSTTRTKCPRCGGLILNNHGDQSCLQCGYVPIEHRNDAMGATK